MRQLRHYQYTPETVLKLKALIAKNVALSPFEHDGHLWAAGPQEWFFQQLGIHLAAFRRMCRRAPFIRSTGKIDNRIFTMLRTDENSTQHSSPAELSSPDRAGQELGRVKSKRRAA